MSQRGFSGLILIIVAMLVLVGAGGYFISNKQPKQLTPVPESKQPVQDKTPENIPQAHNIFGFNALKLLTKKERNNNVFISPSSISLALSMVYNGANGETKNAIQKTLQFQKLDIDTVNRESLGLINSLKSTDPKVELAIANSVWARKGVDFKKEFLNSVENYYNAEISTLDFSDVNAADTINSWVNKNTKNKIPTIVTPPIDEDMVMYLINAVYFKGSWTAEFDKKLTQEKDFTTAEGMTKKHPLMSQKGKLAYLATEDFESVSLPYGTNKRLSMYVFLPKKLGSFVQSLNIEKWTDWMKQYKETEGTFLLPRFKIQYEKELKPILTTLGMGIAFQDNADLTGIGESLKISEVKHKTYVDVNEEGTEAAAVTSVGVGVTSFNPEEKTFYMEVNRPFFFVIRDNQTEELLFMGTIQNP